MTKELMREGKIVADAPPGKGTIPDPRRFVYLEGCGEVGDAALAFARATSSDQLDVRPIAASPSTASRATAASAPRFRCRAAPAPATCARCACRHSHAAGKTAPPHLSRLDAHQQGVHARRAVRARTARSDAGQGSPTLAPGGPPLEIPVR